MLQFLVCLSWRRTINSTWVWTGLKERNVRLPCCNVSGSTLGVVITRLFFSKGRCPLSYDHHRNHVRTHCVLVLSVSIHIILSRCIFTSNMKRHILSVERDMREVEGRACKVYLNVYGGAWIVRNHRATSHTRQDLWPWNCESPKKVVQRPSQDTSKIM